jgi:hypothetical protein
MDVQSYAIAASWAYLVALDITLATDITVDSKTRISTAEVGSVGWGYHRTPNRPNCAPDEPTFV